MYVIKSKLFPGLLIGMVGGIILSFTFINPYNMEVALSEAVLQLSGSTGEFPLLPVFTALISFTVRMLPNYIFEIYMGTELYHHFCTASIYIFSRTPHRVRWYTKQILGVAIVTFLVQMMQMFSSLCVTAMRFELVIDRAGILLMMFHIVVYTMWFFAFTILVNLVAIQLGSNHAFLIIGGVQFAFTALLKLVDLCQMKPELSRYVVCMNPVAHLVVGWHVSRADEIKEVLASPYEGMYLGSSVILMLGICILSAVYGMYMVYRHDFLISHMEGERG